MIAPPRVNMPVFFGLIVVLFIAILVGVYLVARRANPVMLDERGRPLGQVSGVGAPAVHPVP